MADLTDVVTAAQDTVTKAQAAQVSYAALQQQVTDLTTQNAALKAKLADAQAKAQATVQALA